MKFWSNWSSSGTNTEAAGPAVGPPEMIFGIVPVVPNVVVVTWALVIDLAMPTLACAAAASACDANTAGLFLSAMATASVMESGCEITGNCA